MGIFYSLLKYPLERMRLNFPVCDMHSLISRIKKVQKVDLENLQGWGWRGCLGVGHQL